MKFSLVKGIYIIESRILNSNFRATIKSDSLAGSENLPTTAGVRAKAVIILLTYPNYTSLLREAVKLSLNLHFSKILVSIGFFRCDNCRTALHSLKKVEMTNYASHFQK
jgi:hypothetical protein